ncbi:CAAX prenyl protease, partial [Oleoguttula sp. CCFEE 5521]
AIDIAKVMGLVMVLFVGPLYARLIVESGWRQLTFREAKDTLFDSWTGYRNFVVAPASEEIVFRSLVIPPFILAKMPPKHIVFLTPLIFGLAHVHHMADFCRTHTPAGRTLPTMEVFLQALLRAVFQFCYTSLFGFFTAFAFLRTGNLYAIILAHSFCNFMGFPRLWGRLERADDDYTHVAPNVTQGKRDEGVCHAQQDESPDDGVKVGNSLMQPEDEGSERDRVVTAVDSTRLGLSWTVMYYVLILAGAYGFYRLLFPLTESPNALVVFGR